MANICLIYSILYITALMCPQLPTPNNGGVVYTTLEANSTSFELNVTARYECNPGYGLTPSGVSPVRTCQSDEESLNGIWTGQAFNCSGTHTHVYVCTYKDCDL